MLTTIDAAATHHSCTEAGGRGGEREGGGGGIKLKQDHSQVARRPMRLACHVEVDSVLQHPEMRSS